MDYPDDADIYEHGIISANPPAGLTLLATTRLAIYSGNSIAIVDADNSSLNERAIHVGMVPVAHAVRDFYEESDLRYCLRASLYHLNQIIDLYVQKCRLFEGMHPQPPTREGSNTSDARILFEVDAFLGAGRRAYDAITNVAWKHYLRRPGRWSSAHHAIKWIEKYPGEVPPEVAKPLKQSWDKCGAKLTDYRDYIMHHVPVISGAETVWMDGFDGRWGATVPLPANPETKSRARSNPTKKIDALTYSHGVATELVRLSEYLMAQPVVSAYIANPPKHPPRRRQSH